MRYMDIEFAFPSNFIHTGVITARTSTDSEATYKRIPEPKRVIYNKPATIVFWNDGTKTVAKCDKEDTYSKEAGFMTCLLKKIYGKKYNTIMNEYCWGKE